MSTRSQRNHNRRRERSMSLVTCPQLPASVPSERRRRRGTSTARRRRRKPRREAPSPWPSQFFLPRPPASAKLCPALPARLVLRSSRRPRTAEASGGASLQSLCCVACKAGHSRFRRLLKCVVYALFFRIADLGRSLRRLLLHLAPCVSQQDRAMVRVRAHHKLRWTLRWSGAMSDSRSRAKVNSKRKGTISSTRVRLGPNGQKSLPNTAIQKDKRPLFVRP